MSAKKKLAEFADKVISDSDYRELWDIAKDANITKKDLKDVIKRQGVQFGLDWLWPKLRKPAQKLLQDFRAKWNARGVVKARRRTGHVAVRMRGEFNANK